MGFKAGRAQVDITGKTTGLSRATRAATGLLRSFGKLAAMSVAGVAASFGALALVIRKTTRMYAIQEQAEAKLRGVLKATGGAAGYSAKELFKYAAELQKVTTFGDEATINMMGLLATFKGITGPTFKRATRAIQDMGTVMAGGAGAGEADLKSAAIMVGKALNDPVKGLTAMTRAGVSFSEQEQKVIKNLAATGKLAEAQTEILKGLEGQFVDTSKAMADTFGGRMAQLSGQWGDLQEQMGKRFLPLVEVAMGKISAAFEGNKFQPMLDTIESGTFMILEWKHTLDAALLGAKRGFYELHIEAQKWFAEHQTEKFFQPTGLEKQLAEMTPEDRKLAEEALKGVWRPESTSKNVRGRFMGVSPEQRQAGMAQLQRQPGYLRGAMPSGAGMFGERMAKLNAEFAKSMKELTGRMNALRAAQVPIGGAPSIPPLLGGADGEDGPSRIGGKVRGGFESAQQMFRRIQAAAVNIQEKKRDKVQTDQLEVAHEQARTLKSVDDKLDTTLRRLSKAPAPAG